ncbi:MAG: SprB repeat-containing protein [Flavobacteriales bacterium]|nr:SprB repeat-containing protein [Flavobacteriales bacterium]
MKQVYTLLIACFSTFIVSNSFAQGDECATAAVLTPIAVCNGASATAGSTAGATETFQECGSSKNALDVWYSFTATSSSYTITVQGVGNFDPVFEVFTGTCGGTLSSKQDISCGDGCIDETGGGATESATYYGFEIGSTVYVRVYTWYFAIFLPSSTDFNICLVDVCGAGTPTNDGCGAPDALALATPLSGTTACASPDPSEDPATGDLCAGTIENTVWYSFTPTVSGNFDVDFTNYNCTDGSGLQMGIFTGACPGPWTQVMCQSTDPPATMTFTGSAGTTYHVVVDGTCGAQCDFDIEINSVCPIANDDCASATDLTANTGVDTQQCYNNICNTGADDDITYAGTCGDPSGAVIWYQITTDATDGLLDIEVTSADFSPHIQTFSSCGGANSFDYCDVTGGTTASISAIPTTGSTTYYFTVSPNAGIGCGDFNLCVTSYPNVCTPSDDCPGVGPTVVGPVPLVSSTQSCLINECNVGATNPFIPSTTDCGTIQGGLTFYEVTTSDQLLTISVTSPDISDPMITVWSDCNTVITNRCATGVSGSTSLTYYAGSGNTILFTITSASGGQTGNFDLCVESFPDATPCNLADTLASTSSSPAADLNGNYLPGTTVSFCYDIDTFKHGGLNYLHAVIPNFGSAWDVTTFTSTSMPPVHGNQECANSTWSVVADGIVIYNNLGGVGKLPDGTVLTQGWTFLSCGETDPNLSFGDGCHRVSGPPGCYADPALGFGWTFQFCFDITTKATYDCTSPEDFTISMVTFGDGETGSWTDIGCVFDQPEVMYIPAPPPAPFVFTVTTTDPTCNGTSDGVIDVVATGGYETLQYQLDAGAGYGAFQTTGTFTGLAAGVYSVQVQDDILCTDVLANITITDPAIPTGPTPSYNGPICEGSTLDLASTSGFTGYVWSGPNAFSSAVQNPASIANATIGTHDGVYSVSATLAGCPTSTENVTVTINPLPVLVTSVTDPQCGSGSDGTATVAASGAATPYLYFWDVATNSQTVTTATGLAQGTFTVSVVDDNFCINSATVTLTDPSSVTATAVQTTAVTCNGGSDGTATASGSGGNGAPFTYNWSTAPTQTTALATGLSSGPVYSVTVYDNSGVCNDVTTVTVSEPATSVTASISASTSVTCNSGNDGTATASGAGGTGGYTYSWSNGDGVTTATGLSAGTIYTVTVTDATGVCNDVTTVTVSEPATSVTASIASSTTVTCNGGTDGTATASGAGGAGGYTYSWSNGMLLRPQLDYLRVQHTL